MNAIGLLQPVEMMKGRALDFYWLYDIATWQLFAIVVATLVVTGIFGALILRGKLERRLKLTTETNEIIGHFLSFTGAFYGIMLGLVAVGAWETYNEASGAAQKEAAIVAALYRDVTNLPAPHDGRAQALLKAYAWDVIHLEWPEQQQGKVPYSARQTVEALSSELGLVDPKTPRQEVVTAEALSQMNNLLEARRYRVEAWEDGLPGTLWIVIISGGLMNLAMTWLLVIDNKWLDFVINFMVASLLGSVLAFIIAMDIPFEEN